MENCKHEETKEINVEVLIGLETRKMVYCVHCNQVLETSYEYGKTIGVKE